MIDIGKAERVQHESTGEILAGVAIVVVALLGVYLTQISLTVTMEMEIAPASTYAEEYVRMIGSEEGIESYSIVHRGASQNKGAYFPGGGTEF